MDNERIKELRATIPTIGEQVDALEIAIKALEQEQKTGHWIYDTDEDTGEKDLYPWTCSECGEKYPWEPKYCPHCGAKMESEVREII